jgi:hypothetical protein
MSGKTVYQEITKTLDHNTGELKTTSDRKVIKKNSTPDFIMLFTQTAPMLADARLTAAQSQTLFEILSSYVSRNNLCIINAATKEEISIKYGLKYTTVDQNIRALCDKEIILRQKTESGRGSQYYLNPHIFGKGSWQDIEALRYEIAAEYNFKTLEYTKKEKVGTSTGLIAASEKRHDVETHSSHIDEEGVEHEEVVIRESGYGNTPALPLFIEQPTDAEVITHSNNELEMLREQNRAKELAIKEMELKIKMHELGI